LKKLKILKLTHQVNTNNGGKMKRKIIIKLYVLLKSKRHIYEIYFLKLSK